MTRCAGLGRRSSSAARGLPLLLPCAAMWVRGDRRSLWRGRYRRNRAYLADHVFGIPGGAEDHHPTDLLNKAEWRQLMDLPTDVALRTTDHMGSMVQDMQAQVSTWLDACELDPSKWPFFHDAYLDAIEEFDAAPFLAVHGFYRQATSGLRNALEAMAHACRYALRSDQAGYAAWRGGTAAKPPSYGNSVDLIGATPAGAGLDASIGGVGLFGLNPRGVLRDLHGDVSRYVHGQPGFANGDIWQSNGPVFIPRAFTQFWLDYCDTSLACMALLKLALQHTKGDPIWIEVAGNAGSSWHGSAPETVRYLRLGEA